MTRPFAPTSLAPLTRVALCATALVVGTLAHAEDAHMAVKPAMAASAVKMPAATVTTPAKPALVKPSAGGITTPGGTNQYPLGVPVPPKPPKKEAIDAATAVKDKAIQH
jgi:type IV secretory pathway VirJ component